MPVPERLNSPVEFHGKNDQSRKNLDNLTIYFFLKTVLWIFSIINLVSLYLLRKHKQICFIIPYSIYLIVFFLIKKSKSSINCPKEEKQEEATID